MAHGGVVCTLACIPICVCLFVCVFVCLCVCLISFNFFLNKFFVVLVIFFFGTSNQ